ncbi:hypothetical protein GF322_03555 [Candidatus Dependentiae bacterium]|nr:hypothetical protein [Candidatus Dependentiae bacterium]
MQKKDKKINNIDSEKKEKEQKEAIEKFIQTSTKEINITNIPEDIKNELQKLIFEFEKLKNEIQEKKNTCTKQLQTLQSKLEILINSGQIKLDKKHFEQTQKELNHYQMILDHVNKEIDNELKLCKDLISENPPKTIRVLKNTTDDFIQFITSKIQSLKKYLKKMKKDLQISFSKYNFGLESQKRKLEYLKTYLDRVNKK